MKDSWNGSCYGIAATMGLLYNNYISLDDLTDDKSATNYYTLPLPYKDKKLLDTINYYQLSQGLANGGKSCAVSMTHNYAILDGLAEWYLSTDAESSFLKTIVNYTTNGKLGILSYTIPDKSHECTEKCSFLCSNKYFSHAILVTGCKYDVEKEQYVVQLYDMNSVSSSESKGEFLYMYIDKEYRGFEFSDNRFDPDSYNRMYYTDWESMGNVVPNRPSSISYAKIKVALGEDIKFVNNSGKYIQFKDGKLSGNMKIYNIDYTAKGDSDDIIFEVDDFSTLNIVELGGAVDIEVRSNDSFMALQAQGIDSAYMDLGESMSISGDDYTFKAFVSTDEIALDEDGLISFSAKATSDVSIVRVGQSAEITSDEKMTDLESMNYSSIYTHTVSYADSTEAKASAQEIVFTSLLGDCDNDGELSILDATEIQRYLAMLTSKYDINYEVCDIDKDGDVSVLDSTYIQMVLAGLI